MSNTVLKLLLILGLWSGSLANAHEMLNSGPVNLEWHTTANERLQAYGETQLSLKLKLNHQPLDPRQCRCTLLLYKGDVNPRVKPELLNWTIENNEILSDIRISQPGFYSLVLDGKAKQPTEFSPFRFTLKLLALEDVYNLPVPASKP